MIKFISTNCLPNLYIYLWPEKWQNHVTSFSEITMENDWWLLILRNHSQWKIVQWSRRSWKSCIPVWKKVYYIFLFLKVSQCKLKKKETILKLGNPLKSKSNSPNQNSAGVLPPPPSTRALHWSHWGPSDSRRNILSVYNSKISPYQNL